MYLFPILLGLTFLLFVLCFNPVWRGWIARFARALWVCRISALSAFLGLLLFLFAAPARDLFAEVSTGWLYWTVFFILTFLWASIVHYAARKALEQQAWAAGGAPLPLDPAVRTPLQHSYAFVGTWIPRLLGFICFVGIFFGIRGAEKTSNLMGGQARASAPQLEYLQWATAGTALLFILLIVWRRKLFNRPLAALIKGDPTAIIAEPSPIWFFKLASPAYRDARRAHFGGLKADLTAVALISATLLGFLGAIVFPIAFGYLVPRAWFVPVMLGLPVFALSLLTAASHRLRFPIFFLLVLVLAGLFIVWPNFHVARLVTQIESPRNERQIGLADALAHWKQSVCSGKDANSANCAKHPIIVALAGGASRAAFLSATVVGDLLDITQNDTALPDFGQQVFAFSGVSGGSIGAAMIASALADSPQPKTHPCGSTDGLWFASPQPAGALNRFYGQGQAPTSWKGCLQSLTAGDFLSPPVLGLAFRDPWGGILALVRDHTSWIEGDDRGALLERAFEERYATLLKQPTGIWSRLRTMLFGRSGSEEFSGLARRLGYHKKEGKWVPLLLLNGTSVDTGRRVIASELAPSFRPSGDGALDRRLFPEAYDLFETLSLPPPGPTTTPADATSAPDIRISTAATLSARFPIVSPYGGLQNPDPAVKQMADRVVDGGYFENDGVTTAYELALALVALDKDLMPIIVHITNDPVSRKQSDESKDGDESEDDEDAKAPVQNVPPAYLPARPSKWFESVINPLTALFGTRGGHAAEAVGVVQRTPSMRYVRFQVFKQAPDAADLTKCNLTQRGKLSKKTTTIDEVSMSWWLSGAVQEYLDRQLCHRKNVKAFKALLEDLRL